MTSTAGTDERGRGDHTIATTMFHSDVASKALGIELLELGDGFARTRMAVTTWMVNGHGMTHGGYVFLLADTTFALACNSHDVRAVAARADIRYVLPTHAGDNLVATATERARYGRNGIYDVTVTCRDVAVAEFRGDSRTIGAAGMDLSTIAWSAPE